MRKSQRANIQKPWILYHVSLEPCSQDWMTYLAAHLGTKTWLILLLSDSLE